MTNCFVRIQEREGEEPEVIITDAKERVIIRRPLDEEEINYKNYIEDIYITYSNMITEGKLDISEGNRRMAEITTNILNKIRVKENDNIERTVRFGLYEEDDEDVKRHKRLLRERV